MQQPAATVRSGGGGGAGLRRQGRALIGLVDDPVRRAIVRKRVFLREEWRRIGQSDGICYDERHCQRLYGKALVEISKKTGE